MDVYKGNEGIYITGQRGCPGCRCKLVMLAHVLQCPNVESTQIRKEVMIEFRKEERRRKLPQ
jgi:hypothetical protein